MPIKVGLAPILSAKIYSSDGKSVDIGSMFTEFEWSSFINGGYNIRIKVADTLYSRIHKIASEFYLKQGKSIPIPITFRLSWDSTDLGTPEFTAYITKIHCDGMPNCGFVEFIAIDPPSFVLRHGTAKGNAWHGNISKVIEDVIKDTTGAVFKNAEEDPITGSVPDANYIKLEVGETNDNTNGIWYQMRMDPATFIASLLEWSSSLTDSKSQWIVASGQKRGDFFEGESPLVSYPALYIKQWDELEKSLSEDQKFFGSINFNSASGGANDVIDFEFLGDNLVGISQDMLVTQGISSTSGLFIDKNYKEGSTEKALVKYGNTQSKLNTDVSPVDGASKAYTLPSESALPNRANSIIAIPEFNGGDTSVKYQDYIDGRARNVFIKLLSASMRICVTVSGWHEVWDSTVLGSAVINLDWKNNQGEEYFLSGDWILYGFKHKIYDGKWYTDLFLSRIDYDSKPSTFIKVPTSRTKNA